MAKCELLCLLCLVSVWLLDIRGVNSLVRRSDDTHPLQAVVEQLANDVSSLQAKLAAKDGELQALRNDLQLLKDQDKKRVAFTAYISEVNLPDVSNGVIRFSHTLTNIGDAYNSNSGAFTAPYDGDYMFIVSVDISPDYDYLTIRKNGHIIVQGHNDGRNAHHIHTLCVMTLAARDTVTVNHGGGEVKGLVDGGSESIFAGFRIR